MKKERYLGERHETKRNVKQNGDGARSSRHIRVKVDGHVRSVYDQIVEEGTPERFVMLL